MTGGTRDDALDKVLNNHEMVYDEITRLCIL